jgi:hypothetical protein
MPWRSVYSVFAMWLPASHQIVSCCSISYHLRYDSLYRIRPGRDSLQDVWFRKSYEICWQTAVTSPKPPTPKEQLKTLYYISRRFTHPNYKIPVWRILMSVCLWHFKVSSRDVAIVKIMWVSMTSRECSYLDRWQFQIWRFGDVKRTLGMQRGFTLGSSAAFCLHTAWPFTIWWSIPHEDHTLGSISAAESAKIKLLVLILSRCGEI